MSRLDKLLEKVRGLKFKEIPVYVGEHKFTQYVHDKGSSSMTIDELSEVLYLLGEETRT